jgi:AraC-like DNA-binding protein
MQEILYNQFKPDAALGDYIKCYWVLEGPAANGSAERVFPDGSMEMIFHYGDAFHYANKKEMIRQPRAFLFGQLSHYIDLAPAGSMGVIGVRFYPATAGFFTATPLHHLTNLFVSTDEIWGSAAKELSDKIFSSANTSQRIYHLNCFFTRLLKRHTAKRSALQGYIRNVYPGGENISVKQMTKDLFLSERTLERKFLSEVGLSPKNFCRIMRLQHTLRLLQKKEPEALTGVAQQAGFYDQAHFIKDFKELTGLTPAAYYQAQHNINDQFIAGA